MASHYLKYSTRVLFRRESNALSEEHGDESNGQVYPYLMHFVYMIKNNFDDLYIGITENPTERLAYHNSKLGAQFTKNKQAFKIVFLEQYQTLPLARRREIQIKKWRRGKKENLITLYFRGQSTIQP